ncbi:exosortase/archaeosortase family protein [Microbacter margulisiae]|uniref:Exosortase/archaeosortase family protein n=1 Tax=Microbacter margulisiae TaxID=1350067 RepID=A0A7W5DRZ1_9PORP|nr:exosortase/archaeosortase family protein [Microbacter margulisiae]MBB3187680.1 exosortase/archaeosortase family protein [Microbacter margulisiae]
MAFFKLTKFRNRWDGIAPYQGVILFFVIMMLANWTWKTFVHDGDYDSYVSLFGYNISWPFIKIQHEVVRVVSLVYVLFDLPFGIRHATEFTFSNGTASDVAWGCTAVKQAFIYTCIIAFSRGPWKHKWWYILAAFPILHTFNVIRISAIGMVLAYHPHYFYLAHKIIFKYSFYFLIFLLWVLWEEVFRLRPLKKNSASQ